MFESLYTVTKGIEEAVKFISPEQIVNLINNVREQNKREFVVVLQIYLGYLKFDDIERVFRMVIDERKITLESKYELINWFGNTMENVQEVINKLNEYYTPRFDEPVDRSRLSQLPRSAADIRGFQGVIKGKEKLRKEVKDFIETHIGYMAGERELNPEEIQEIEELQSKMEVLSVEIGKIHDSLNRYLNR